MKNTALLVHSCDRYELLYKAFGYFFAQNWDFNTSCNYYFATEDKEVEVDGFVNIRSGKGEWADRLKFLLQEKIKEKYIIYFQEDMWLNAGTDANVFNQLFELAEQNDWQQVKLHSAPIYKTKPTDVFIENFNVGLLDNAQSDFLMSHQVTLWNREFLIRQLHKGEHPWRNERKGTQRLKKLSPEIFHIDLFSENDNQPVNSNKQGIKRSSYFTVSMNGTFNDNIKRYTPLLRAGGLDAYAEKIEYNFENKLVHDGQQRPKKTDPFKRLKNFLLGR
ncbi:MAG: hypothetical protein DI535_06680 [Citrobacter freundii]|nr:MAG: hypothetical protein DI535_06680 [Citrobacter freundii]